MRRNRNDAVLHSLPQSITIERPAPPLFAPVIGIDKYLSNGIRNLSGATLRIPKGEIENLRNKEATRVTIETEINDLGNNTTIKKGDPILIFAGHGTETNAPAPTGRYKCWLHTILSPVDRVTPSKVKTVIFDYCHSGSGTRTDEDDPTFAVRGIDLPEAYTVAQDLLHDIEPDARASVVAKGFEKTGLLSHVLLSGQAEQTAMEKYGRGVFTSALLSLLREKGVDKRTYKDVIINLPDLHAQNPQCEGVHQSRYLFNSKVANPQRESYLIRASSDTPGQYILEAGEAHGITKGAELAVFADRIMTSETQIGTVVASSMTAFTTTCDFSPRNSYILEAGEAHGITRKAQFVVFADRRMTSALGTVVAISTTAFTATCKFSSRGNRTPFPLTAPGYALQTRVGEDQDVRLFVEPDKRLRGVFKRTANKTQAGKRGFRLVESRDDELDLVVAADGDVVHFEIMDKLCRQHGLTRMPFEVKIDDADAIHRILRSSSDFYWHLHRSNKRSPLAGKVTLGCMKLKETGKYADDLLQVLKPDSNGENLNVGGVIMVDVDEGAIYGFEITNTTSVLLYVSMFYFDVSDLSISSYYQPGCAKKDTDVSLPPGDSLTIGYDASGMVSHMYRLRKGQHVDVGFLKRLSSTEYMDLSVLSRFLLFMMPVRAGNLW
ncbi:hypothetical protein EV421DRAFT_2036766 [Armillaria borealis]|uniref:Peptidase C14 caspase domain-containing protein n=1 Tax=Armillaria borealis TaxID=47425 RepID=A0AA39JD33_9AGAR|nr:hypothetical protein EV421DRAFT_2036766 [Armillaria borealis]